ncbi:hypothetical protein HT576_20970 [Haloterrigena sp. SYSU A121-1]|uniref:Uncharacterized protein n=1 Tax=Haloterrigena gelatinilytica TaxID=2741724 RepID=A0A8J8GS16_9EURY|nr:hypothetical protein [Haloterrigena gelatinilytica]NUB93472.1 hypothetical protein [Haloterrigena gelatinilytica]
MGVSGSIEKLSQTIERYEAAGGEIHRVDATVRGDGDEPSVAIDVVVPLCSAAGVPASEAEATPRAATVEENGGLCLEFPSSVVPEIDEFAPADVSCVTEEATVTSEGTVVVTFDLGLEANAEPSSETTNGNAESDGSVRESTDRSDREATADSLEGTVTTDESKPESATESEDERALEPRDRSASDSAPNAVTSDVAIDDETERALAAARNEDLPPYDDVEYLECLYDSFDTFTAMAEVLEMDVASETVRRYMIDAGIHEPTSYETTASDEDDATADGSEMTTDQRDRSAAEDREPMTDGELDRSATADDSVASVPEKQLVADGIGLPEDIEINELMDAIESSMTLHDVTRELGLERSRTRELLEQLNLLDLVVKRVYGSADPERPPSRNEIADRIRESVTHGQ